MFESAPNMWGNELEKDGAAWIAEKENLPMLSNVDNPRDFIAYHRSTHA